ncbi:hypothetical protein [Nocardia alni]|uniref:hypothetical protein n=1 Tax=Nocardia alni TaxID=2815723 RepID=UPI001C24012B|nr:hypothetical protein [Nocardia alni]
MDVHDIDDPEEVIAAAGRYRLAASAVTDRVEGTLRELVLPRRAESVLDRALAARLHWVCAALSRRVDGHVARVDTSIRFAVTAVRALEDADRTGAGHIRGSGPG